MKAMIFSMLAVLALGFSTAEACDVIPQGRCYIEETGETVPANQFFSKVANLSNRLNGCTVGRVKGLESGRMYIDGKRKVRGLECLSHNEIRTWTDIFGYQGECPVYTCEQY